MATFLNPCNAEPTTQIAGPKYQQNNEFSVQSADEAVMLLDVQNKPFRFRKVPFGSPGIPQSACQGVDRQHEFGLKVRRFSALGFFLSPLLEEMDLLEVNGLHQRRPQ